MSGVPSVLTSLEDNRELRAIIFNENVQQLTPGAKIVINGTAHDLGVTSNTFP